MIHVMATADLGGAAMATPVVGDDAIAVLEEEQHLRVPIIGRQRPAMTEHDGLTLAPVLVEDLNAVFGGDRVHRTHSLGTSGGGRPRLSICGKRRRRHGRGGKRGGARDQEVSARCATFCRSVPSHSLNPFHLPLAPTNATTGTPCAALSRTSPAAPTPRSARLWAAGCNGAAWDRRARPNSAGLDRSRPDTPSRLPGSERPWCQRNHPCPQAALCSNRDAPRRPRCSSTSRA